MSQSIRSFLALLKASMKMYYRNKGAIVFTLLIPVALLSIFGFLSRGSGSSIKIAVSNHGTSELAMKFVDQLSNVQGFRITQMTDEEAAEQLGKGEMDLEVVVPEDFGIVSNDEAVTSHIKTFFNKAKPQAGQIANLVVIQIVNEFNKQVTHAKTVFDVKSEGVTVNNLGYFDFILPGILSMTIMQLGIFGVAFSFVALKANGALRRLQATPAHPIYFVFAQATVRLLTTLGSSLLLLVFGIYFFDFHMIGSYLSFTLVCILGILIFLGMGFSIAGWARDETQVAPVANLIQLPMLLLSGIFFPREAFPNWLKSITDYFPLTYVVHGLRKIANEGVGLIQLSGDMIGMVVWLVLVYALAVRVFRWE